MAATSDMLEQLRSLKQNARDFPRGGGSMLTPKERAEALEEGRRAAALEAGGHEALTGDADLMNLGQAAVRMKRKTSRVIQRSKNKSPVAKPGIVQPIVAQQIRGGMVFSAVVSKVKNSEVHVTLAGGTPAVLRGNDISRELKGRLQRNRDDLGRLLERAYAAGDRILCTVKEVTLNQKTKARQVFLSADPHTANKGYEEYETQFAPHMQVAGVLASHEDHGWMVDLSMGNTTGFLSNEAVKDRLLVEGQAFHFSVSKVQAKGRLLQLAFAQKIFTDEDEVLNIPEDNPQTIQTVFPGQIAEFTVTQILDAGLKGSVYGIFEATIDYYHLPVEWINGDQELTDIYDVGEIFNVQVHWVDHINKKIGVIPPSEEGSSMSARVLKDVGTKIQAKVGRIVKTKGFFLNGNSIESKGKLTMTRVFVPMSKSGDGSKSSLLGLKTGGDIEARIIGHDLIDSVAFASTQSDLLEETMLNLHEAEVGQLLNGTIESVSDAGAVVKISKNVRGFVPVLHVADYIPKKIANAARLGDSVRCRVLQVDAESKKLILTMKRSLVKAQNKLISDASEAKEGMTTNGVITSIRHYGVIVSFLDKAFALVPRNEIPMARNEMGEDRNLSEIHRVGEVVTCVITNIDRKSGELKASMRKDTDIGVAGSGNEAGVPVKSGDLVTVVTQRTMPDGLICHLVDEESGEPTTTVIKIFKSHVSDATSLAPYILKMLGSVPQTRIENVLIIEASNRQIEGSIKGSLVTSVVGEAVPTTFEAVEQGALVPGYVKKILNDSSALISFPFGLIGFLRKEHVADKFVSDIRSELSLGQSVHAKVLEINKERQQIKVTLQASQMVDRDIGDHLEIVLEEKRRLAASTHPESYGQLLGRYEPSVMLDTKITGMEKLGATLLDLEGPESEELSLLAVRQNLSASGAKVGKTMRAVTLDADIHADLINVTCRPDVVEKCASGPRGRNALLRKAGQLQKKASPQACTVLLAKESYAVVFVNGLNCIAYMISTACQDHGYQSHFQIGQETMCKVADILEIGECSFIVMQEIQSTGQDVDATPGNAVSSVDDVNVNDIINVRIINMNAMQLNVEVSANVRGRVHITEALEEKVLKAAENDVIDLSVYFKPGQFLKARVLGLHDTKTHRFLPISQASRGRRFGLELSLKTTTKRKPVHTDDLKEGKDFLGVVQEVHDSFAWVVVSPDVRGRLQAIDAAGPRTTTAQLKRLNRFLSVGKVVRVWCLHKHASSSNLHVDFSLQGPLKEQKMGNSGVKKFVPSIFKEGTVVNAEVMKHSSQASLLVKLASNVLGSCHITDLSDNLQAVPLSHFPEGTFVRAYIDNVAWKENRIDVILRESVVESGKKNKNDYRSNHSIVPDENAIVKGYVTNMNDKGLFIALTRDLVGRCRIAQLSDQFLTDWKDHFAKGQMVKCRVLSVDTEKRRVALSLRKSALEKGFEQAKKEITDFKVGDIVRGHVRKLASFGVFVNLEHTRLSALCHVKHIADEFVKDASEHFSIGDYVKGKIIDLDLEKRRIGITLKPSAFKDDEHDTDDEDDNGMDVDADIERDMIDDAEIPGQTNIEELEDGIWKSANVSRQASEDEEDDEESKDIEDEVDQDSDEMEDSEEEHGADDDDDDDDDDASLGILGKRTAQRAGLGANGFSWGDNDDDDDDAEDNQDDEDDNDAVKSKQSRSAKRRKREQALNAVDAREQALASGEAELASVEDFEKLVLAEPNSSYAWVQYMAFHISMGNIDGAREIGERALDTINFRETDEKFKVWCSLINIEISYGKSKTDLDALLKRAMLANNPKHVMLQRARIHRAADDSDGAVEAFEAVCKKFRQSKKCWLEYVTMLFKDGNPQDGREVFQRALKALPQRKHVFCISKYGQLEFKFGDAERGRTIFEGIVDTHPKRLDIWNVYVDQEIKAANTVGGRRLLERMTTQLKLSTKKMKFVFKKWLDFEKKHGTSAQQDHVKQRAREYVQSLAAKSTPDDD
eukprot:Clim_evm22s153 gene=Clim_evmTU22s153